MYNDASLKYTEIIYYANNILLFKDGNIISCCCMVNNLYYNDRYCIWYYYDKMDVDISDRGYRIEVRYINNSSEFIDSTIYVYYI